MCARGAERGDSLSFEVPKEGRSCGSGRRRKWHGRGSMSPHRSEAVQLWPVETMGLEAERWFGPGLLTRDTKSF